GRGPPALDRAALDASRRAPREPRPERPARVQPRPRPTGPIRRAPIGPFPDPPARPTLPQHPEVPMTTRTDFAQCMLCEALCGLEVEHDGRTVARIRGDAADPFSRGHVCPKGAPRAGPPHH